MKRIVIHLDGVTAEYHFPDDSVRSSRLDPDSLSYRTLMWFEWYLGQVDEKECSSNLLKLIGRHLAVVLFPDEEIRNLFFAWCRAADPRDPLRVRLDFGPKAEDLARCPWEFFCIDLPDRDDVDFLSARSELTLVRHIACQEDFERGSQPLKVLLVLQSPPDELRIETSSLELLLDKLEDEKAGSFIPRVRTNLDWHEVRKAINEFRPDVFHFAGHGETGVVWLARASCALSPTEAARSFDSFKRAAAVRVTDSGVAQLFADHHPRLVVLDACESAQETEALPSIAHAILRQRVQAVVAMHYKISNPAAETFNTTLYQMIADGERLDVAVQQARMRLGQVDLGVADDVEPFSDRAFGTPVLYLDRSESVCDPLPDSPARQQGNSASTTQPGIGYQKPCPKCLMPRSTPFCGKCGIQLRCTGCGSPIDRSEETNPRFCAACGMRLPDADAGVRAEAAAKKTLVDVSAAEREATP